MLDGHVPLETGETTRDELYLSGLEGETRREREARREGGRGAGAWSPDPKPAEPHL